MGIRYRNAPHFWTPHRPLSQRAQQQITLSIVRAYFRFCDECSIYPHYLANHLLLMAWIAERRIEMEAGPDIGFRPTGISGAERDGWDDLIGQPSQGPLACEGV